MPPMGVCDILADDSVDGPTRLKFWLLTHGSLHGAEVWRIAVIRECLPDADNDLHFEGI